LHRKVTVALKIMLFVVNSPDIIANGVRVQKGGNCCATIRADKTYLPCKHCKWREISKKDNPCAKKSRFTVTFPDYIGNGVKIQMEVTDALKRVS
jgi:hypothetical protein